MLSATVKVSVPAMLMHSCQPPPAACSTRLPLTLTRRLRQTPIPDELVLSVELFSMLISLEFRTMMPASSW